jgi:predicted metal-binding membrane protein
MAVMNFETVLRRDRAIIATALAVIAALSWIYLLTLLWRMNHSSAMPVGTALDGMDLRATAMAAMTLLATPQLADLPVLFLMWSVMLVGMMTPSAAPMILLYARIGRQAQASGRPMAATSWFAAGYLLVWIGFALLASLAQVCLQHQALLSPAMDSASRLFAGFVLLAAGLFQWGPLKDACLGECRMPQQFIQNYGGFRPVARQSLALGWQHGAYCIGCCWALMALLFVGGVMNMLWVAGLSILVLLEKLTPVGQNLTRLIGAALLAGGGWILLTELA